MIALGLSSSSSLLSIMAIIVSSPPSVPLSSHQAHALVRWCRSHDWGQNAIINSAGTVVSLLDDCYWNSAGEFIEAQTSFPATVAGRIACRAWAGY